VKKADEKPQPGMGAAALVAAAAVALALGGVVLWLQGRAERMKASLEASIEQYDAMKILKPKVSDLGSRVPKGPQEEIDGSKIATFLSTKAAQAGLPNPALRSGNAKSGGWIEHQSVVDLRGARDGGVPRGPFVDFLAAVERERPYLKSKSLQMTFANGPDLSFASVTVSYFKRE